MPDPVPVEGPRQPREEATFTTQDSLAPDNRRRAPRYLVDLDVTMSSDHNFYAGFAENLSSGGLFIATHKLRPVGVQMEIVMNLPGLDEPIRATGIVCWTREYSEQSNVPPGMGFRFVDLAPAAAVVIERFVRNREPMFYDED